MKLHLAPMEGIMDFVFRDMITQNQNIDQCTTEFIRVSSEPVPDHVLYRHAPELKMNCKTRSGTPVLIQLLGGKPEPMAANALRLTELGATGIDLNFGCPAKTVNRHDGGAALLRTPHRLYDVTKAVRDSIPVHIPLSAKMRLGFEDTSLCLENAKALEEAGVEKITVHARTKADGYKPPAHWEYIARIKENLKIPIIANGDIKDQESLRRCQDITGCDEFMIGRASLYNPNIFKELKTQSQPNKAESWNDIKNLIIPFFEANALGTSPWFAQARTKQWLNLLSQNFAQAKELFNQVKTETNPFKFEESLRYQFPF